jgi:hypothetical protein
MNEMRLPYGLPMYLERRGVAAVCKCSARCWGRWTQPEEDALVHLLAMDRSLCSPSALRVLVKHLEPP